MARPGGIFWLLRHELRLLLAQTRPSSGQRRFDTKTIVAWTVLAIGLHGAAWAILADTPALGLPPSPAMLKVASVMLASLFLFMMASAMKACVEVLYERGDFDLLLSSPLSTRSILTVRMAAVVARVAGIYLVFLAPLANVALALGRPRLLAVYPAVLALSMLAAAMALLLVLALAGLLGVRAARGVAQVLGPLFGAALFIGGQLYSSPLREPMLRAAALLQPLSRPGSAAWLAARAALGEAMPAMALATVACAAQVVAALLLHRFFARCVQLAAGAQRTVVRRGSRFQSGLTRAVLIKEWRLIARDPQLVAQVLLQTLYLLPLLVALFARTGTSLPSVATAATFLCASITSALTWIVIAAEDAPELLASSPASARTLARAKLLAVALPVLALVALPVAWVGLDRPAAGAVMGAGIALACTSAALIAFWFARPAPRSMFRQRAKGNALAVMFDLLSTSAWGASVYLLVEDSARPGWQPFLLTGATGAILCALLFLALARLWRQRLS